MQVLFWCSIIPIFFYVSDTFVFLFGDVIAIFVACFTTSIFTLIVFIWNSCYLCKSLKDALLLYFLVDNSFVILVFTLVSWNFYVLVMAQGVMAALDIVALVFVNISFWMFVGNFRILILRYEWSKSEVITTKLLFVVGTVAYVGIACYFMYYQGAEYNFISSTFAGQVKDFSIFYAIALFTLYIDMYSKISSKDGTDDQKYHYTIELK